MVQLWKLGVIRNSWFLLLTLFAVQPLQADNRAAEIKAAFVYNFAKFVEWPEGSFDGEQADLTLCSLSGYRINASLELIEGRSAQGRTISLKKIHSASQVEQCHILYLPEGNSSLKTEIIQLSAKIPVLTVGDYRTFIDDNGMVGLFIESNLVRFRINLHSAQASGLKVSARILNLAQEVR